jgi:hypothetical protein
MLALILWLRTADASARKTKTREATVMILPYIIEQSIFIGWIDVEWTYFTNLSENIGFVCFFFINKNINK